MSESCIECGTEFPEGESILCKCWDGTEKQKRALEVTVPGEEK